MYVNPYYYAQNQEYILQMKKQQSRLAVKQDANKTGLLTILAVIGANVLSVVLLIVSMFVTNFQNLQNIVEGQTVNFNSYEMYFLQGICSIFGFFIIGIIYSKIVKLNLNNTLVFQKVSFKETALLVMAGMGICMLANFVTSILQSNFSIFGMENTSSINMTGDSFMKNIMQFIIIAVAPALCEEFLFRGIILGTLRKHGDNLAIFGSALLFGLMHGNLTQIPFAFMLGIAFGFITVKTNSMLPAILLHFFNNGFAVIVSVLYQYFDESLCDIIQIAAMLVFIILGIIAFKVLSTPKYNYLLKLTIPKPQSDDLLTPKERFSAFMTSPGIVVSIILFAMMSLLMIGAL